MGPRRPSSCALAVVGDDARKVTTVFVEVDTRHTDGLTISLEWDRDTGQTQIVIDDAQTARQTVVGVASVNAADALRHPFRYAP